MYPGWVTGTGTGQYPGGMCVFPSRRGGQPRRANDIADEPPHRYPRRIRHKAPAPFSSSFRDDSNHPRDRSAVPPPRLSRSRSLPARPSAPEMTDGQLHAGIPRMMKALGLLYFSRAFVCAIFGKAFDLVAELTFRAAAPPELPNFPGIF